MLLERAQDCCCCCCCAAVCAATAAGAGLGVAGQAPHTPGHPASSQTTCQPLLLLLLLDRLLQCAPRLKLSANPVSSPCMNRTARFSSTMPSLPAKKARTYLMKCCSAPVQVAAQAVRIVGEQLLHTCCLATHAAVEAAHTRPQRRLHTALAQPSLCCSISAQLLAWQIRQLLGKCIYQLKGDMLSASCVLC